MPRTPDNEIRTTVTDVKEDRKRFRAAVENGRIQEFTLSTQGFIECPSAGDEIIIWYNIQAASTDPEKIARYGTEPTYWANKIESVKQPETDAPAGTYETAQQEAADRVQENQEPKKDYPDHQAITRESIERQVALKAAVEMWKGVEQIPDANIVADYARNLYAGLFNHALGHTHADEDVNELRDSAGQPVQTDDPGPQPD